MANITKCKGTECPYKVKCYKYTAEDDKFAQSYFLNVPYNKETESCEYYEEE